MGSLCILAKFRFKSGFGSELQGCACVYINQNLDWYGIALTSYNKLKFYLIKWDNIHAD